MSDFLEVAAFRLPSGVPVFSIGDTLAGRFVIVQTLGRGGMGEVYEARDLELGTLIALKTIRGDVATSPEMIDRFRREVIRARAVAHRNVCRVFDLFAHEDGSGRAVRFLTMELIAGETLSAHLTRVGRLTTAEALDIATQIGAAIDAAHRLGIVHRDLKPGNVMLTGQDAGRRAVVTDFGLAMDIVGEPGFRSADVRAGTVGYAAPEQLASAPVSGAADIYSFGVLLHEMVTGGLPKADAPLDRTSALPRRWARAIAACLQHDPAARPSSAAAVLDRIAIRRSRRSLALAAVLVAGVALGAGILRFMDRRAQLQAGREVLVADIVNATQERDLDGVTELVRRQLDQSRFANVVPADQVRLGLRELSQPPDSTITAALGRELLRRRRAGYLASGTLRGTGTGYVLTVRLEARTDSVAQRPRSWARSFEARDREELRTSIQRGAAWLRATIGERTDEIPRTDRPVAEVTTSSWQALALYTQAESLLAQSREEDGLALLEEAVRADPDFAAAWMRLADVLMSRREHERAYDRWSRALQVLNRRQLGSREEYRIRGMFASDAHDFAEAERVYRLYIQAYPDDFTPYFYIGRPLMMLGRPDEAIGMLEQAAVKDATSYSVRVQLGRLYLRVGRFQDAQRQIAGLRAQGRADWAESLQGQLDFLEDRFDVALRRFEALERAEEPQVRMRAVPLQVALLADLGRSDAAIRRLVTKLDRVESGTRADRLIALAALRLRSGDRQGTRDALVLAEQSDRSPIRVGRIASLFARSGSVGDAERLLERLPENSWSRRTRADRLLVSAEIELARDRPREAWRMFQAAAQLEPPGVYLEYLARGAAAVAEDGAALAMHERMARDPAYYWRYPDEEPGEWFDSLRSYLRLAGRRAGGPSRDLADRHHALATVLIRNP